MRNTPIPTYQDMYDWHFIDLLGVIQNAKHIIKERFEANKKAEKIKNNMVKENGKDRTT